MEGVVVFMGFYPTYMGWAKGLELTKLRTGGSSLNLLIHRHIVATPMLSPGIPLGVLESSGLSSVI
jgi:hypothetical protein